MCRLGIHTVCSFFLSAFLESLVENVGVGHVSVTLTSSITKLLLKAAFLLSLVVKGQLGGCA